MKRLLLLSVLTAGLAAPAAAQDATVYIGHGINGTDVGLTEELPVDITVNGGVLLTGVEFRTFTDALSLPAGSYSIQISAADPQNPGSQPPLIDVTVPLVADENVTILAHLDAAGAPTASKFANDTSSPGFFFGTVQLAHAAAAPEVDLRARSLFTGRRANIQDVPNGVQATLFAPWGLYSLNVFAANTSTRVLGPAYVPVFYGTRASFYVVGSLSNGTLEILSLHY